MNLSCIFKICIFSFIFLLVYSKKVINPLGLPVIIWWSDLLYPHERSGSIIKCSSGSCISNKHKLYQNESVFISYIFYGNDFNGESLPLPRRKNNIWALLHEESPMNNYIFSHKPGIELFNYTSTFSRLSHFPLTTQFIPSIAYLVDRKPLSVKIKNDFRRNGTAPILYLQSHCNVASDRDRYVKELMKYVQVDSLGACLHNKDLPTGLQYTDTYNDEELFSYISRYKFQIAFENAICDDYITEKLFRTLHIGVVPIYKGSPSVKDWIPSPDSVILIDDFKNPSELADFILKLDQNDKDYNKYLSFKERGTQNEYLVNHLSKRPWGVYDLNAIDFIQGFECFICDKMYQPTNSTSTGKTQHMNCHLPEPSLNQNIPSNDEWLLENWKESYRFAYDQAKAIETIIKNRENNTGNFIKYLSQLQHYSWYPDTQTDGSVNQKSEL